MICLYHCFSFRTFSRQRFSWQRLTTFAPFLKRPLKALNLWCMRGSPSFFEVSPVSPIKRPATRRFCRRVCARVCFLGTCESRYPLAIHVIFGYERRRSHMLAQLQPVRRMRLCFSIVISVNTSSQSGSHFSGSCSTN